MTLRLVAVGDSLSCGEGVGLRVPLPETWPARLADALPGAELLPLAVPGAQARDVRDVQLPAAVAAEPHLATVLVGLNDVARGGFRADAVADDVHAVVDALRRTGATVLLGRLHDPCRVLPVPGPVRGTVRRRVDAVNRAVDDAARAPDVHVLDLARVPALALRAAWDVDRLHPTPQAHLLVAAAAAAVLRSAGLDVGPVPLSALPAAPSPLAEVRWAARHGLPWLATRGREALAGA